MVAPTHLKSFQALALAARLGSLKAAAERLSITPAAVGQRVKALESYLGLDLLVRGRSGLQPTPWLAAALPHLTGAFAELDTVAEILNLQRGHEIHIAAASDFAELWLKPRLGSFLHLHPNIVFCINGEGAASPRVGQVDCEISFGAQRAQADVLFRDFVVPISSPANHARLARLRRRDRLEGFPLLHIDFFRNDPAVPSWTHWSRAQKFPRTAPERGIRFQRITAVVEAVMADAGLTLCGLALLADLVAERRLALPFGTANGTWSEHAYQAHFRTAALQWPQVRRFRQWLTEESATTRAWLTKVATTKSKS